ncbi:MAG: PAS domain S-box protein [Bacillota bacterium]
MKKLVHGALIVIIHSYDADSDCVVTRALDGNKSAVNYIKQNMGNMVGRSWKMKDKARSELVTGKLLKIPGKLHELSFGTIQKELYSSIEQALDVGDIFVLGFAWEGRLFGNAVVIMKEGLELPDPGAIEIFINLASLALQRKLVVDELQRSKAELERSVERRTCELAETNRALRYQIDGRAKTVEALEKSNQKYQLLMDHAPVGIYEIDLATNRFISMNGAMCRYLGYSEQELLSMSAFDILTEESKKHFAERVRKMMSGEPVSENSEYEVVCKDGRKYWAAIKAAIEFRDGKPVKAYIVAADITERKKMEQDLRLSEERFRKVFDASPNPILITVLESGRIIDVNQAFLDKTGYTREEVISRTPVGLGFIDQSQREALIQTVTKTGSASGVELRIGSKRGKPRDTLYSGVVVEINGDQCLLSVVVDITERKRMEEELRNSHERINNILESISDGFYAFDDRWCFTYINKKSEELLPGGKSREELLGRNIWETYPEVVGSKHHRKLQKVMSEKVESHFETRSVYTGQWFEVHAYPAKDGISVFHRNISKRKKLEDELKQKNDQITHILDSITDALYVLDTRWRFVYLNDKGEELLPPGKTSRDVVGRNVWHLFPEMVGTDYYHELWKAVLEKTPVRFETTHGYSKKWYEVFAYPYAKGISVLVRNISERKSIEEQLRLSRDRFHTIFNACPVPMVLTSQDSYRIVDVNEAFLAYGYTREELVGHPGGQVFGIDEATLRELRRTIKKHGCISGVELTVRDKRGEARQVLYNAVTIDVNGGKCILGAIVDVTERKKQEQEMLRLERLNLAGQLAAVLAHEIRNPIASVKGLLELAGLREEGECSWYRSYAGTITKELDRANLMIKEFLNLAKEKPIIQTVQNLNAVVESVLPLIKADANAGENGLKTDLQPVPDLLLDEQEIRQVILNLTRNGFQAMQPGGCMTVQTFVEGDKVVLAVTDQGSGVKAEFVERLGEPFFSTKEYGTGLGLSVCHRIAQRHNALVSFETGPGGTTFYVKFKIPYNGRTLNTVS